MSRYVRLLCGQFVKIIDDRCMLIHETAKDFLLGIGTPRQEAWYSFKSEEAHLLMSKCCINYLHLYTACDVSHIKVLQRISDLAAETTHFTLDFPPLAGFQRLFHGV